MKIRSYNDQHSTRISLIPIVAGLKSCAQTLRLQPLKPVLLIVADREKQLSLNTWEAAFRANILPSQRGVVLRTSFVVGRDRGAGGGALSRLLTLVKMGLGGTVGSGIQGMSWVHELDMNRLFELALFDQTMKGAYIASSPYPVCQREFMATLAGWLVSRSAYQRFHGWCESVRHS